MLNRNFDAIDIRNHGDERVIELANQHVCVTRHFLHFFTSRAAAYRATSRLRRQRSLRAVGHVVMAGGRPEVVFCNAWKPKTDQLRHEVLLTDFLLGYAEATVVRGWKVDSRIRADAEMELGGRRFYVELDTGAESHRQVQRRYEAYKGVTDYLLVVTLSERRLAGLIAHADAVRSIALFTTLGKALETPRGEIWTDVFGTSVAI